MSEKKKSILMRAYLIYILVLIYAVVVIIRIVQIQFVQGDYWRKQSSKKSERTKIIEPTRGNIYSEDSSLLATSIPTFEIKIDFDSTAIPDSIFKKNIDSLGICLSLFFDKTVVNKYKYISKLKEAQKKHDRNYTLVKKATYEDLQKIRTFPILRKGKYGGLIVIKKDKRIRPIKNLAPRTIGYERLSEYMVVIDLKSKKITGDLFMKNVDTLSRCFASTFNDFDSDYYKKQLLDAYQGDGSGKITKLMNELQLEELTGFPLIRDTTLDYDSITKNFDKVPLTQNHFRLGILDITKLTKSYYVGLEGYYRQLLRGKKGYVKQRRVGTSSWVEVEDKNTAQPVKGCDLFTSIDGNLQDVAQNALRKSLDTNKADWGCVILMEVKTGYIKAITNFTRKEDGSYVEIENYAYHHLYEPGSTMKLASVIAVLEDGKYDTSYIVNSGKINYPEYGDVVDSHEKGYGNISVAKAFEKSSNVGITQITRRAFRGDPQKGEIRHKDTIINGKKYWVEVDTKLEKFKKYVKQMGLCMMTGIDLLHEPAPELLEKITREDLVAIAFGYYARLTPLQMLAFYNAVANNGCYMKPKIVKEIRNGVFVYKNRPEIMIKQICSEGTLKKVKNLLEGVVQRGTARVIRKAPYKIAGKTGTAKIYDVSVGDYVNRYVASFCGYFPADDPKYSCIVVEYNMRGINVYGSDVAAPVFKEIADKVYATRIDIKTKEIKIPDTLSFPEVSVGFRKDVEDIYQGLNMRLFYSGNNQEWVSVTKSADNKTITEKDCYKSFSGQKIPNVIGMKAKDAVYILEKAGMKVLVSGAGRVIGQKNLLESKTVELRLSI